MQEASGLSESQDSSLSFVGYSGLDTSCAPSHSLQPGAELWQSGR